MPRSILKPTAGSRRWLGAVSLFCAGSIACGSSKLPGSTGPGDAAPAADSASSARDGAAPAADAAGDAATSTDATSPLDAPTPDATTAPDGGAATDAGGPGTVINSVYITWYGFNDNSCQVESQHNCNTIAYPVDAGFPTRHNEAVEGQGTYAEPITFATACGDDGMTDCELLPGTIIYVPEVRKYFVMEDQCAECGTDWSTSPVHTYYHTDLWMGPSVSSSDPTALNSCEDKLTLGNTDMGTGTIVVDPPSNYPVDTTTLFTAANVCTAVTYPPNTVP
jgi:hypothetical protein